MAKLREARPEEAKSEMTHKSKLKLKRLNVQKPKPFLNESLGKATMRSNNKDLALKLQAAKLQGNQIREDNLLLQEENDKFRLEINKISTFLHSTIAAVKTVAEGLDTLIGIKRHKLTKVTSTGTDEAKNSETAKDVVDILDSLSQCSPRPRNSRSEVVCTETVLSSLENFNLPDDPIPFTETQPPVVEEHALHELSMVRESGESDRRTQSSGLMCNGPRRHSKRALRSCSERNSSVGVRRDSQQRGRRSQLLSACANVENVRPRSKQRLAEAENRSEMCESVQLRTSFDAPSPSTKRSNSRLTMTLKQRSVSPPKLVSPRRRSSIELDGQVSLLVNSDTEDVEKRWRKEEPRLSLQRLDVANLKEKVKLSQASDIVTEQAGRASNDGDIEATKTPLAKHRRGTFVLKQTPSRSTRRDTYCVDKLATLTDDTSSVKLLEDESDSILLNDITDTEAAAADDADDDDVFNDDNEVAAQTATANITVSAMEETRYAIGGFEDDDVDDIGEEQQDSPEAMGLDDSSVSDNDVVVPNEVGAASTTLHKTPSLDTTVAYAGVDSELDEVNQSEMYGDKTVRYSLSASFPVVEGDPVPANDVTPHNVTSEPQERTTYDEVEMDLTDHLVTSLHHASMAALPSRRRRSTHFLQPVDSPEEVGDGDEEKNKEIDEVVEKDSNERKTGASKPRKSSSKTAAKSITVYSSKPGVIKFTSAKIPTIKPGKKKASTLPKLKSKGRSRGAMPPPPPPPTTSTCEFDYPAPSTKAKDKALEISLSDSIVGIPKPTLNEYKIRQKARADGTLVEQYTTSPHGIMLVMGDGKRTKRTKTKGISFREQLTETRVCTPPEAIARQSLSPDNTPKTRRDKRLSSDAGRTPPATSRSSTTPTPGTSYSSSVETVPESPSMAFSDVNTDDGEDASSVDDTPFNKRKRVSAKEALRQIFANYDTPSPASDTVTSSSKKRSRSNAPKLSETDAMLPPFPEPSPRRPRRAAASINFKEPSLGGKLRQGDPIWDATSRKK